MDVLPRLKLLNVLKVLLCSLVRTHRAKGIYLREPVQGLHLNHRSISGLEPEMPVTRPTGNSDMYSCGLLLQEAERFMGWLNTSPWDKSLVPSEPSLSTLTYNCKY
jgi:hypothetical protein